MRRIIALWAALALLCACLPALGEGARIAPAWEVPDHVRWVLETAAGEVGYREGDHGWSKYGAWAGDPYAQWCAEFLCWCVDQAGQAHGVQLLDVVWPRYSGSNTGRSWFIRNGRFIVRWGHLENWGYQWLKGEDRFLTTGSYIPQPGDWVFFTWTSDQDTDHVAMVEYCTREADGSVTIHVIEGNTPNAVKRAEYPLTYKRILGFGTVHDCADWTMRSGNSGMKVRQLQEKLVRAGYLPEGAVDGVYGGATQDAVRAFQREHGIRENGIANLATQTALNKLVWDAVLYDPSAWQVDGGDDDEFSLDGLGGFDAIGEPAAGDAEITLDGGGDVPDTEEANRVEVDVDLDDPEPDWVE